MILIIGLFYPSLHSNPKNPPIKAFIFSLLAFFWLSLSIRLLEEKGEEAKAQGRAFFDAQPCSGEGSKKDYDQNGLSITQPRTGTPTGFVQRSRLDFGLGISPYRVDIISVCISYSHPRRAFIPCYRHLFSHLSIILSLFSYLLI